MQIENFSIPSGNGYYNILEIGEFQFVDPIEHFKGIHISSSLFMERDLLALKQKLLDPLKDLPNSEEIVNRVLLKRANKDWEQYYSKIRDTVLPLNLLSIFECQKKKEQILALRNVILTPDILTALIFTAWEKYTYSYSMYKSHHLPNGLSLSSMPTFACKTDDNSVDSIGPTDLSKGQIRSAIEQRKVVIAKFLDNGKNWHCFFYTYNSILGKETGETPHVHYLSDAWGISRSDVIKRLKVNPYKMPSTVHLRYQRNR